MRRISAGFFVSLDGVVEAPDQWHFPYVDDEMMAWVSRQNASADAMLFGRTTYESFAAVWPHQEGPMADYFNAITKYVVSSTLTHLDWQNSSLLQGDPPAAIAALKEGPGGDIAVSGSTMLVRSLLAHGLLDELSLLVHPIVLGAGERLFDGETGRLPLTLTSSTPFAGGVVALTYRTTRASGDQH